MPCSPRSSTSSSSVPVRRFTYSRSTSSWTRRHFPVGFRSCSSWLVGVVGWLLLRPYRRITQMGGKDPTSAVVSAGSWRIVVSYGMRAMRLASRIATPGGTAEPRFGRSSRCRTGGPRPTAGIPNRGCRDGRRRGPGATGPGTRGSARRRPLAADPPATGRIRMCRIRRRTTRSTVRPVPPRPCPKSGPLGDRSPTRSAANDDAPDPPPTRSSLRRGPRPGRRDRRRHRHRKGAAALQRRRVRRDDLRWPNERRSRAPERPTTD